MTPWPQIRLRFAGNDYEKCHTLLRGYVIAIVAIFHRSQKRITRIQAQRNQIGNWIICQKYTLKWSKNFYNYKANHK